jgi:hypothetical protein
MLEIRSLSGIEKDYNIVLLQTEGGWAYAEDFDDQASRIAAASYDAFGNGLQRGTRGKP